ANLHASARSADGAAPRWVALADRSGPVVSMQRRVRDDRQVEQAEAHEAIEIGRGEPSARPVEEAAAGADGGGGTGSACSQVWMVPALVLKSTLDAGRYFG